MLRNEKKTSLKSLIKMTSLQDQVLIMKTFKWLEKWDTRRNTEVIILMVLLAAIEDSRESCQEEQEGMKLLKNITTKMRKKKKLPVISFHHLDITLYQTMDKYIEANLLNKEMQKQGRVDQLKW